MPDGPYIVTTKRPGTISMGRLYIESRLAVATLEEARREAVQRIGVETHFVLWLAEARSLPESGGMVGPLPDGTVIEVERIGWFDVAENVRGERLVPADKAGQRALLDAYNAQQEHPGHRESIA